MSKFWRHLKSAWLYYRVARYVEQADEEGFWTEDDAINLSRFFDSYSGRKFKMRLTNYTIQSACNAVNQTGDYARNTGVAAGVSQAVTFIQQHFPQATANTGNIEDVEGETALDALAQEAV